jgi:hypothetical protein
MRSLQEIRATLGVAHQEYGELAAKIEAGEIVPAVVQHVEALAERLKAIEQEVAEIEAGAQ